MITYIATNTETGQFYIGSTTNFLKRQQEHLTSKSPYPFQRSLQKNPEKFTWEFIENEENDRELEQLLLDLFFNTSECYNLSPDAIAPMKGKKHTSISKLKIGMKHQGKIVSLDTRRKISLARLGISTSLKGRTFPGRGSGKDNSQSKRVEVTFPTGLKKVFDSGREAATFLGCNFSSLHTWARTE